MATATLDDYLAFNEQLAALAAAGVPLDVDLASTHRSPLAALERINATVARRVNRGESLAEAVEGDDGDLPPSYRSLVQIGLHEGDLAAALGDSNTVAESVVESRTTIASAFVYPLIVCLLTYIGFLSLCFYFEPTLRSLYTELHMEPSSGLKALQVLRSTLPYWSVAVPLVLLAVAAWQLRPQKQGGAAGWRPGTSKPLFLERCGRFAATLAELLTSGIPLGESLRIAGDGCGDRELRSTALRLAASAEAGPLPEDHDTAAKRFPPFLRWAIWHADETTGRVRALEIAARLYRETAQRQAERFRAIAPVIALVCVGGTATLLYALALIVPIVQLLYGLSR
jgi:general secretion pathway protein F